MTLGKHSGRRVGVVRKYRWGIVAVALLLLVPFAAATLAHHLTRRERIEAQLSRLTLAASDSVFHVEVGDVELSLLDRSYRVTDIRFVADSARIEWLRGQKRPPRTHGSYRVGAIYLDRIDLLASLSGDIDVGTVRVVEPQVQIYLDRKVPLENYHALPLPHEWMQRLDRKFRVDTVSIERGEISYWERAVDGARPGKFRFANVWSTVAGVTNDRAVGDSSRTVIDVRATLGGSSSLEAQLAYDLLAPRLRIKYRGRLAAMDARAFNAMLVDLEGIRIDDGDIRSIRFDIDVEDDLATGRVTANYHDLSIAIVDKVTRDRSLKDLIKSVFANKMKIREDNPDGDEAPMVAAVRLRRQPETPLIKFIWHTLRAGLSTTVGL